MNVKSFLMLVKIQTKVVSVLSYFLGLSFTLYHFEKLNTTNMIVMFFSMFIFNMTVSAINNYHEHTRAIKKHGNGYETYNPIGRDKLSIKSVKITICIMLIISVALGAYLVYLTNYVVLALVALCFFSGICYSCGSMPISRTPYGEIACGLIMGLGITFIVLYINIFDQGILNFAIKESKFYMDFNLHYIVGIILVSLPAVLCIDNIMLANNICDINKDVENERYTLPIVIGKNKSLVLLALLYYFSYFAIIAAVIINALPLYSLISLLTIIPVLKNVKAFQANPTNKYAFVAIGGNFVIMIVSLILTIVLGIIF